MARGRAANGSGTQPRLRADGRWEVKYCAGRDPGTGKLIRKSLYGKTFPNIFQFSLLRASCLFFRLLKKCVFLFKCKEYVKNRGNLCKDVL